MAQISTDLGITRESARSLRFEETTQIQQTNVQQAIQQLASLLLPLNPPTANSANSPYNVTTETLLLVDTSGGAVTINLPAVASRSSIGILIKDITGHCLANNATIVANGTDVIDSVASIKIASDFGGYNLLALQSGWGIAP